MILAAIAILGGVFVLGRSNSNQTRAAPPPLTVEVVQVEQSNVPVYSEWIGTTEGMVNAEIKAQVTGYLLRQNYKEGSFVTKGQLLFEIDPRPFQATLDRRKESLFGFSVDLTGCSPGQWMATSTGATR